MKIYSLVLLLICSSSIAQESTVTYSKDKDGILWINGKMENATDSGIWVGTTAANGEHQLSFSEKPQTEFYRNLSEKERSSFDRFLFQYEWHVNRIKMRGEELSELLGSIGPQGTPKDSKPYDAPTGIAFGAFDKKWPIHTPRTGLKEAHSLIDRCRAALNDLEKEVKTIEKSMSKKLKEIK